MSYTLKPYYTKSMQGQDFHITYMVKYNILNDLTKIQQRRHHIRLKNDLVAKNRKVLKIKH